MVATARRANLLVGFGAVITSHLDILEFIARKDGVVQWVVKGL